MYMIELFRALNSIFVTVDSFGVLGFSICGYAVTRQLTCSSDGLAAQLQMAE
jgi:hypothetical protein